MQEFVSEEQILQTHGYISCNFTSNECMYKSDDFKYDIKYDS